MFVRKSRPRLFESKKTRARQNYSDKRDRYESRLPSKLSGVKETKITEEGLHEDEEGMN